MALFTGAAVAIVTPFKADGSVDYEQFGKNIEFQIEGKSDAIVVCGSTGEASTLTMEEHMDVIKYCVEKVNKRVPVIAGTGSNCTKTAILLSQKAEEVGADAVLVVAPYYNKPTQKGLYQHFKAIADSIKIPVILYNIPGRTGINVQPQTTVKLCREVPNIIGTKEATGDLSQVARLIAMGGDDVDVYCGDDNQTLPFLSLGAKGVISVLSNIAPLETHQMCQDFFDGNIKKATETQISAIALIDALFSETNPIPIKKAMNIMGNWAGPMRAPLTEMEDEHAKALEEEMRKFGLKF